MPNGVGQWLRKALGMRLGYCGNRLFTDNLWATHGHRLPLERWVVYLLHRSVEGVEVSVEDVVDLGYHYGTILHVALLQRESVGPGNDLEAVDECVGDDLIPGVVCVEAVGLQVRRSYQPEGFGYICVMNGCYRPDKVVEPFCERPATFKEDVSQRR